MNGKAGTIAVLSGKGGAGKTLVSVNLAAVAEKAAYIDCDVEEPNGHLFFKPKAVAEEAVSVKIPTIDKETCSGCRKCVDFCKFNALAMIKNKPYVFEEVCHACGGCLLLCPKKAIREQEKSIGKVQKGVCGKVAVSTGILNPGETSGIPIIKALLKQGVAQQALLTVIDCPPGSACAVMESIKDADYCLLVAEPTVFGAHNLQMVYELVQLFGKPHGVVLNKCLSGENPAEKFCEEKNLSIIGRIPFDKELGARSADAKIAAWESEKYRALFSSLLVTVRKEARHETAFDPQR
ncbi:MAG: ATPase [Clostridia bacterium]|nr:ATPase [Clostridia bacterium]